MPEIVLNGAGVLAVIGQLVAAGMAQHVAMHRERKASCLTGPCNHALIAGHR